MTTTHGFMALMLLGSAACGGSDAPPLTGADGMPRTGSAGGSEGSEHPDDPPKPDALALQRAAVQGLVEKAGVTVDLATAGAQPVVHLDVALDEASRTFTATATIDLVNAAATPLAELAFELPANVGAANAATTPLTLDRVEVDGKLVDPRGDRARWSLPVTVAPGAAARVVVKLAGRLDHDALPPAPPLPADPQRAATIVELMRVLPPGILPLPEASPRAAFGERGGVTVLWGIIPRLAGTTRFSADVTLTAPGDLAVASTGLEVGRERKGSATAFHLIAVDVPDLAVVTARGLASTQTKVGGVALTSLAPSEAAQVASDALAIARRAFETLEPAWGRAPLSELEIVSVPALDGVGPVVLPGLVLVPAQLFHGEAPRLKDDPFAALLAHHPAPKEALDFDVAAAVAAQWWLGRGADASARLVLEHGLSKAAGLRVIEAAHGDKAARRALELGVRLPFQIGREGGEPEPTLSRFDVERDAGMSAPAKAGLFAEALTRHLGAQLYDEALRGLRGDGITLPSLRDAWLAKAPRRAETTALMARWLDETHASDDVGPIRPEVLLEYFVADGLVDGASGTLLDELAKRPDLLGKGLGAIGDNGISPGLALELFDELTGDKDPALKKWLDRAKGMLGNQQGAALSDMIDELGGELGLPEADRARLKQMTGLVWKALGETGPDDAKPDAPLDPEPSPADP